MMRMVFRPIRDSLKRVQGATKENIKSQKDRANVMKEELVTIGNFISSLSQEEESKGFENAFWDHVYGYWPTAPAKGELERLYKRITGQVVENKDSSANGNSTGAAKTVANGASESSNAPTRS
jgi:chromodomain-helicase-DNA-binding protein 1